MLGEKGLAVAKMWADNGVRRVHFSWGPDAGKLTGEERAQLILDWEYTPGRFVSVDEIDGPPRTSKPSVKVDEFVAALAQSAAPVAPEDPYWKGAYERMADRNVVLSEAVKSAILVLDDLATGQGIDIPIEQIIRDLNAVAHTGGAPASPDDPYDRGRRDILNALLAPNPAIAAKIAKWAEPPHDPDPEGRLPFDVALWITEVAEQLGIKSLEELGEASPVQQAAPSGEEG
jgi:hypothetical protein